MPSVKTPAARGDIRRNNVSVVLRHLRDHGPRSRTEIARALDLPNSTVSRLVATLVDLDLVTEGERRSAGAIGRPHQAVTLRSHTLCGIGVEISVNYIRLMAVDLPGDVLLDRRAAVDHDSTDADTTLALTADLIAGAVQELRSAGTGVIAVTVATPGQVDSETGVVRHAANLGWWRLPVVDTLTERLGPDAPPVRIDNDARLGAVAEHRTAGVHDLLYVTGEVGVGGGIVIGDSLVRGGAGYAGEIGHMPLGPGDRRCGCGRRGCWETVVGLDAFLEQAADPSDHVRDPLGDLEERLATLDARIRAGEPHVLAAVDHLAEGLATGIGLLVNVLDPQLVILGGYFSYLGDPLLDQVSERVADRVLAPDSGGCEIRLSTLGFTSAALGAAETVLDELYRDPISGRHRTLP